MCEETAILMRDCDGWKEVPRKFLTFLTSISVTKVLRGELLVAFNSSTQKEGPKEGHPSPNYRLKRDPNIVLYCNAQEVTPLIDQREVKFLEAVFSLSSRHAIFVDGSRLEWAAGLAIDSQVYLKIPGPNLSSCGVCAIRCIGPVGTLPGWHFGVEIIDDAHRGCGSTDGTFEDKRYFVCADNDGLFVSLDRISKHPFPASSLQPATPNTATTGKTSYSSAAGSGPSTNTRSKITPKVSQESSIDAPKLGPCQFKNNERVMVYDKKGKEVFGRVRWYGDGTKKRKFGFMAVGIETEAEIFLSDFEEHIGSADQHGVPKYHWLVMPETMVNSTEQKLAPKKLDESLVDIHSSVLMGKTKEKLIADEKQVLLEAQKKLAAVNAEEYHLKSCPHNTSVPQSAVQILPSDDPYTKYVNIPSTSIAGNRSQIHVKYDQLQTAGIQPIEQGQDQGRSSQYQHGHNHTSPGTQPRQHQNPNSQQGRGQPNASLSNSNPYNLGVGSPVQVMSTSPNEPPRYGVIRWIGHISGVVGTVAGIELDEYMEGCTDGVLKSTGERFFSCAYGHGLYFPLSILSPDQRFTTAATGPDNPLQVPIEEQEDQNIIDTTQQMRQYLGNGRGIQGHQNSSYLDSTVFGLFALSDVFDTMFLEPSDQSLSSDLYRRRVTELLWKGIVNPLRKNGVVRYESVMRLRTALDELGKMEGITDSEMEKDPEEFLNMLFKYVLHTKPFISIRRPFGVEQEFFVQLFVEHDPNLRLPTVGDLLHRMFREQRISFTKIPSKLLLQIPRFGQEFQTYKRLIPELKLEIGDLSDSRKACTICGVKATVVCESCESDRQQSTNYCQRCSDLFHKNTSHKERADHKLSPIDALGVPDLLSVICIETSHYVCFTRDLRDDGEKRWIFFDSMADRQYDTYNIPRVTDCTRELNEWVYQGDRERLFSAQPRELPELVRRFTQDVYMCVYIQPDIAMYGDGDEVYGEKEMQDISSVVSRKGKDDVINGHEQEIGSFREEIATLKQNLKNEQTQRLEQEQITTQQLADKNAQNEQLRQRTQQLEQEKQQLEHQKQQAENEKHDLRRQSQRYQQQITDLQQRLEIAETKTSQSTFTKVQIPQQDEDSWNVRRQEVTWQNKLGNGAWGSVFRGAFRGQRVAVKRAHEEILHQTTIDQLKREIRIMIHVQHPNLVRLLAAVVDERAEKCDDSPLLVLELLDTDLRSAYTKKIVNFEKNQLISIFRDVAYALHYLHEHQEPIIHRDVSAPNVLLQKIAPGVWKAKLSDFGSANLAKHCKSSAPGAIVYAAPETFPPTDPDAPLPKQTTKIDVFSYGYLLVEAFGKKMPSPDKRKSMLEDIKRDWRQLYDTVIACIESKPDNRLTMTQVLEKLNMLS